MISSESTLEDVCYAVSAALEAAGIFGTLTGGSAAAIYAPHAYMSLDADFVLDADASLDRISVALEPSGFRRINRSRMFSHPQIHFTVDFPKGPLAVAGDYIRETATLERDGMRLRILRRIDCIRDRLAHYYYWNDFTALHDAVSVAAHHTTDRDLEFIRSWTKRESPDLLAKFEEFRRRLIDAD